MERVHIGKLALLEDRFDEEFEWDATNADVCGWKARDLYMIKEGFLCASRCISNLISSSIDGFVYLDDVISLKDKFEEEYHINMDNAHEFGWSSRDVDMLAEGLTQATHIIEKDIIFKVGEFI